MCKIKMGNQISCSRDYQNLITGLIFRTKKPFDFTTITQEVLDVVEGSDYHITYEELTGMIQDTITALLRANYIKVILGRYYPC